MDSQHLLVPIKVQALVIDDIVIKRSGVVKTTDNQFVANAGRWSPQLYDYQPLVGALRPPGPRPFYGAKRDFQGHPTESLVLDPATNKEALPEDKDRGVYLHWILPAGLRHAYTPGLLDFPALPDHWLIVRFSHQNAVVKTRAWFVDAGAIVSEERGNLLFCEGSKYTAKTVGKVTPFEEFGTASVLSKR